MPKALSRLSAKRREGIELRQSYTRVIPKLERQSWLHARGRKYKKAAACVKNVKTIMVRQTIELSRKASGNVTPGLNRLLCMTQRVLNQEKCGQNKLCSCFEPETACIAKGKADKKYEFGAKVSATSTHKGNFIIGPQSYSGCPNNVTTLKSAFEQTASITGISTTEACCDKGCRGKARHAELECSINIPGTKQQITVSEKKRLRRRNAIGPKISHLKSDHGMDRNFLKGEG